MTIPPSPVEARFTLLRRRIVGRQRRTEVRHRFKLATSGKLFFPDSGESVYAWVSNFSAGGVGLRLPRPLAVGVELVLDLRSPSDESVHRWPARVVRATRDADDTWCIGCAFVEELPAPMLQSLLD
jgi:hypothetical protein